MKIPYYWINVDNSKYRRIFMEQQFKKLELENKRISAITPETLETVINDKSPYYCGNNFCKCNNCDDCKFEYSCSSSHLVAIREGYKSGEEYFIVCEDDIYIPFTIDFDKLIKNLPEDWELFQMMVLDGEANKLLYSNYKNNIEYMKYDKDLHFFSTGMYLINRKGAEKLLNMFIDTTTDKFELTTRTPIKQADFLLYINVNTYTSTFPFCFPNLKFVSEIHPTHIYYHIEAIKKISENLNNSEYKNRFITKYHSFEEFDKFFINYIKNNNI